MQIPLTHSHDRWPLRLASLLFAVGAVLWFQKTGHQMRSLSASLPFLFLLAFSVVSVIAAERLRDGPALTKLCAALVLAMRLAALLIALPELVAMRLPVRWEVFFGLTPPKEECPIYYRMPDTLFDGNRFLKRTGPDTWTGKPLGALLRMKHSRDSAYSDEATFTVHYDQDGFRNASGMMDWDVVVAGDSFVELASLPDGETITDQTASCTGMRLKNLGVASTGAMNHAAFLRHFGAAPSCKHAVLVWGEIALDKTTDEWLRLREHRSPVSPPPDNSLLRASLGSLRARLSAEGGTRQYANAVLTDPSSRPVPVMLDASYPPAPENLSAVQREALRSALVEWSATARAMEMEPWLVFLPSKIRIWKDRVTARPDLLAWEPNRLPEHVGKLCNEMGIRFVDTTAALKEASQRGELVYNPVVDGHPTRAGSRIIANTMAHALKTSSASRGH